MGPRVFRGVFLPRFFFFIKKNFFLTFIFERERGGGAEREGDTESEAGSRLWAVSTEPDVGLKLLNLKRRPELKLDT